MRPSNKSRSRNKPGNNGHSGSNNNNNNQQRRNGMGNIINRVFESAGPDGKVRGTPQQIIDKYQALARDAQVSGDRVAAESFLQYSEHYTRILGEAQRQQMETRYQGEREDGQPQQREDGFDRRPQPQPQQQATAPASSGLAMIDAEDGDDYSGPIETPEGRREQRRDQRPVVEQRPVAEPRPVAEHQPVFEPPAFMAMPMPMPVETPEPEAPAAAPAQAEAGGPADADAAPPVRKTRPRKRKPAAEVIAEGAEVQAAGDTASAGTPEPASEAQA